MRTLAILIVITSHIGAAWPALTALRRREVPSAIGFACLSFLVFYDLSVTLEVAGVDYENPFFESLFDASDTTFYLACTLLLVGPWTLRVAALLVRERTVRHRLSYELVPSRRWMFYGLAVAICSCMAYLGARELTDEPLWATRTRVGAAYGALIMVLFLPLHFLVFYVRYPEARTVKGRAFILFLLASSVAATLAIAQRTTILLPILVTLLFGTRISAVRALVLAGALTVAAGTMLPLFKWHYGEAEPMGLGLLVARTIHDDVGRAAVLGEAIEISRPTQPASVLPLPYQGYIYSALFFVPRSIAPFKGESTAKYFTAWISHTPRATTDWGVGLGFIEELALNGGWIAILPGVLVYGLIVAWLDRGFTGRGSGGIAVRLGAMWLCGYNLPALFMAFGAMIPTGAALTFLFSQKAATDDRTGGEQRGLPWRTSRFLSSPGCSPPRGRSHQRRAGPGEHLQ